MIIEPKIRGFICTTAHPAGCAEQVGEQIAYVRSKPATEGAKRVLVIGASTGYGLATRIAAAFSGGAATLGVIFDKPAAGSRTASAGWYNTAAFEEAAQGQGLYAKTVNGDAFSEEIKEQVIDMIREDLGNVDMVIYSLASPRRGMADGSVYTSVLKTTGEAYTNKTIDLKNRAVSSITIEPASDEEIQATVKVMGGEDWMDWMCALSDAGVLAEHVVTAAYSYIGPELTHPMYFEGSIGRAKRHLYETTLQIQKEIPGTRAYISVNKALVTQSSAAIPIVPLYISLLYKVMKEKGLHEGCIEQMERLWRDGLCVENPENRDHEGCLRLDDLEMREDVQKAVSRLWEQVDTQNVEQLADLDGYWEDFYRMFGFHAPGVDYTQEVDAAVEIPSLR